MEAKEVERIVFEPFRIADLIPVGRSNAICGSVLYRNATNIEESVDTLIDEEIETYCEAIIRDGFSFWRVDLENMEEIKEACRFLEAKVRSLEHDLNMYKGVQRNIYTALCLKDE